MLELTDFKLYNDVRNTKETIKLHEQRIKELNEEIERLGQVVRQLLEEKVNE